MNRVASIVIKGLYYYYHRYHSATNRYYDHATGNQLPKVVTCRCENGNGN